MRIVHSSDRMVVTHHNERYYKISWATGTFRHTYPTVYTLTIFVGNHAERYCYKHVLGDTVGYEVYWTSSKCVEGEDSWTCPSERMERTTIQVPEGINAEEIQKDPWSFLVEQVL